MFFNPRYMGCSDPNILPFCPVPKSFICLLQEVEMVPPFCWFMQKLWWRLLQMVKIHNERQYLDSILLSRTISDIFGSFHE